MKKLKWIILILMLFIGMSYATVELGALEVGAYRVPAPDFYEDFADNLNDWTNDASFAITSGELSVDTSTDYMYVTSPPFVNETYQAIQFELVNGDWSEWKILMRCNSSGDCYGFNINDSLDTLTWVENNSWDETDQVVELVVACAHDGFPNRALIAFAITNNNKRAIISFYMEGIKGKTNSYG